MLGSVEVVNDGSALSLGGSKPRLILAILLADEIAVRAPLAVRAAKKLINHSYESFLSDGLAEEKQVFYNLFASEDQKEGMQAFIEKRKANWSGK